MLPSADRTPTSPILEHNSKYSNKRAYLFLMLIDNARKSQHMATKPLPIFSRWTLSVITASQPARQPSSPGFKKNHRAGTTNPLTILNYNDVHACPFFTRNFPSLYHKTHTYPIPRFPPNNFSSFSFTPHKLKKNNTIVFRDESIADGIEEGMEGTYLQKVQRMQWMKTTAAATGFKYS
jgi:hypothetical protein